MKCFEFKKLALSDPRSRDQSFVEHSATCPDCLKYVGEIRKMDTNLAASLDIQVPTNLVARLQLNTEISMENESPKSMRQYAIAASFALALFVAGFMASNQFSSGGNVDEIHGDYLALVSGVVDHMHEESITPVWNAVRANKNANALLASYDGNMKLNFMENLQFSKICPMGKYKGLHASIETSEGQVTFAYIKGDSVGNLFDANYEGYMSRVKPVRGGNLIILSKTMKALDEADDQLKNAMHWDI